MVLSWIQLQTSSGSHAGIPDGSENPDIDNPWDFFDNTGMHGTEDAPISVISVSGKTAALDFSGWRMTWNGVESPGANMGSGAWAGNADGVAEVICGVDCSEGDTYSLFYSATVLTDSLSLNGGVQYLLHLEGSIIGGDLGVASVPIPAAVWLFGSGLAGLVGVAHRRKA